MLDLFTYLGHYSFNGAALVGVRNDVCAGVTFASVAASTGPHSLECGMLSTTTRTAWPSVSLQRGRTRWSAEWNRIRL